MLWYLLAIMLPALVLSFWFGLRAYNELAPGADPVRVLVLGALASDNDFTPLGRKYRLWSLAALGAGIFLTIWVYLLAAQP
jgi:hypothetical protein